MPRPLSSFFSQVFEQHSSLVDALNSEYQWNCVEKFEAAKDYAAAIEEFRIFYGEKLLSTAYQDEAQNFYVALNKAKENFEKNQPPEPVLSVLEKHAAIIRKLRKSDLEWNCMALFEVESSDNYGSAVQAVRKFYTENLSKLSENSWNDGLGHLLAELEEVQEKFQTQVESTSEIIHHNDHPNHASTEVVAVPTVPEYFETKQIDPNELVVLSVSETQPLESELKIEVTASPHKACSENVTPDLPEQGNDQTSDNLFDKNTDAADSSSLPESSEIPKQNHPLSSFFSQVFCKYSQFVAVLESDFDWNCVGKFEAAEDYDSAIEEFRIFYGEKLLTTKHKHTAENFYAELNEAKEDWKKNQPPEPFLSVLKKHVAIITTLRKSDLKWDCMALFESGTSDNYYYSQIEAIFSFYQQNFDKLANEEGHHTMLASLVADLQSVQKEHQAQVESTSEIIHHNDHASHADTEVAAVPTVPEYVETEQSDPNETVVLSVSEPQPLESELKIEVTAPPHNACSENVTLDLSEQGNDQVSDNLFDKNTDAADSSSLPESHEIPEPHHPEIAVETNSAPFDETETALLEAIKVVAQASKGNSRTDINQIFSVASEHASKNKGIGNQAKRSAFCETLIQTAVQNLSFKSTDALLRYLASARVPTQKDPMYLLIHYQFLSALIRERARKRVPTFIEAKEFIKLAQLANAIEKLAHECKKSTSQNIQLLAEGLTHELTGIVKKLADDPDSIFQIDDAMKKSDAVKKASLENLKLRVVIAKLPVLQVIINLHPEASAWFLNQDFARAISTMSALSDQGVHAVLMALLKVCFNQKEDFSLLRNTLLLLFMLMEKPTHAQFMEMMGLLNQHKTDPKQCVELLCMRYNAVQTEEELFELGNYIAEKHPSLKSDLKKANDQASVRIVQSQEVSSKEWVSSLHLAPGFTFKQYHTLLLAASASDQRDDALMSELLQQAINQAKTADDMLSLAPACKTAESARILANGLLRFNDINYLKTLMQCVDFKQVIADVVDDVIGKESQKSNSTNQDYERWILAVQYPNGVKSYLLGELIGIYGSDCLRSQDKLTECQQFLRFLITHSLQSHPAAQPFFATMVADLSLGDYKALLTQSRSAPEVTATFMARTLPTVVDKVLLDQVLKDENTEFDKALTCEWLLSIMEKKIAPYVGASDELNQVYKENSQRVNQHWAEQLVSCDKQLEIPEDIRQKNSWVCYAQGSDPSRSAMADYDQQVVEFKRLTHVSDDTRQTTENLQQANTLFTTLLAQVRHLPASVTSKYQKLEEVHQANVKASIQMSEDFQKRLVKDRARLEKLREEVIHHASLISDICSFAEQSGLIDCQKESAEYSTTLESNLTRLDEVMSNLTKTVENFEPLTQDAVPAEAENLEQAIRGWKPVREAYQNRQESLSRQLLAAEQQLIPLKSEFALKNTEFSAKFASHMKLLADRIALSEKEKNTWIDKKNQLTAEKAACDRSVASEEADLTICRNSSAIRGGEILRQDNTIRKLPSQTQAVSDEINSKINGEGGAAYKKAAKKVVKLFDKAMTERQTQMDAINQGTTTYQQFLSFLCGWSWTPTFIRTWIQGQQAQIRAKADNLSNEINLLREKKVGFSSQFVTQDENQDNSELRDRLGALTLDKMKSEYIVYDDDRLSFWQGYFANRSVKHFVKEAKALHEFFEPLSEINAITAVKIDENFVSETKHSALLQREPEIMNRLGLLQTNQSKLEKSIRKAQEKLAEIELALSQSEADQKALTPIYQKVLIATNTHTELVECLYSKLDGGAKLDLLKKILDKKPELPRFVISSTQVCASVLYHAVLEGTAEMLALIIPSLKYTSDEKSIIFEERRCEKEGGVPLNVLSCAVSQNDVEKVKILLSFGADKNQKVMDDKGNQLPLLLWAYQNDKKDVVKSLLDQGVDCNVSDHQGNTLLHWAVLKGERSLVIKLLENKAFVQSDAQNEAGETALTLVAKSDALSYVAKYDLMEKLLEKNQSPKPLLDYKHQWFALSDARGNSLLHRAIEKKNVPLVNWLLQSGDVRLWNAENQVGVVPLQLAVEVGAVEIVEKLLQQRQLNYAEKIFYSLLRQSDALPMIELFIASGKLNLSGLLISEVAACRDVNYFDRIMQARKNSHMVDDEGNTLLHFAVMQGNLPLVKQLITKYDFDPHVQNKAGLTPLMLFYDRMVTHETKNKEEGEMVDYLLDQTVYLADRIPGHVPDILTRCDNDGNTLLHHVVAKGDVGVVMKLVSKKPKLSGIEFRGRKLSDNPLDKVNYLGDTAVHVLAKSRLADASRINAIMDSLYKEGGVQLDLTNHEGNQAVRYAHNVTLAIYLSKIKKLSEHDLTVLLHAIAADNAMAIKDRETTIHEIAVANNYQGERLKQSDLRYKALIAKVTQVSVLSDFSLSPKFYELPLLRKQQLLSHAVIGRKAKHTAMILDAGVKIPDVLYNDKCCYIDFSGTDQSKIRFWVSVLLERRTMKMLPFRDRKTGNTLLHALVLHQDTTNLAKVAANGLYVPDENRYKKTALTSAREGAIVTEDLPVKNSIRFLSSSLPESKKQRVDENNVVYRYILKTVTNRLAFELKCQHKWRVDEEKQAQVTQSCEMIRVIIADLDLSQALELKTLLDVFDACKSVGTELTDLLWECRDKNGQTLAQALLARDVSRVENQTLLLRSLSASNVSVRGQSVGSELDRCHEHMTTEMQQFIQKELLCYCMNPVEMRTRFEKNTSQCETDKEKYENLYQSVIDLTEEMPAGCTELEARKINARNMLLYIGLFIESTQLEQLVTLPAADKALPSLLKFARETKVASLYRQAVQIYLSAFGILDPVNWVENVQSNEKRQEQAKTTELFAFFQNSGLQETEDDSIFSSLTGAEPEISGEVGVPNYVNYQNY